MFNIKFPIGIIILLIITVIINVFSTVTIEYFGISYEIFRTYEIECGNIYEVINCTEPIHIYVIRVSACMKPMKAYVKLGKSNVKHH